jgi:hypothetical protein
MCTNEDEEDKIKEESVAGEDAEKKQLPPFTPKQYNSVANKANLTAISLISSHFEVKPAFFENTEANNLSFRHECKDPDFVAEEGVGIGFLTWYLEARSKRKKVLTVTTEYVVVYRNMKEENAAAVKAFVEKVGTFATYPYFRAHVSYLSWASETSLPILPVISTK